MDKLIEMQNVHPLCLVDSKGSILKLSKLHVEAKGKRYIGQIYIFRQCI